MERTETRSRDELLNLYSIQEIDVANIRKVGKDIVPRLEELVALFYDWLETQPEFDEFFSDEETLARIKSESHRYWQQFFEEELDDAYIAQRRRIGETHARIDLPLPIYFAAMNRMLLIFKESVSNGEVTPEELKACMDSVTKLNYFDSGLVVDGQRSHRGINAIAYGDVYTSDSDLAWCAIPAHSWPHRLKTRAGYYGRRSCEDFRDKGYCLYYGHQWCWCRRYGSG